MKISISKLSVLFIVAMFAVPVIAAVPVQGSEDTEEDINKFIPYYDQLDANRKAIYDAVNSADADTYEVTAVFPVSLTAGADDPKDAVDYLKETIHGYIDDVFDVLRLSSPAAYWGWDPSTIWSETDLTVSGRTATVTSVSLRVTFTKYPTDPDTGEFSGIGAMLDDLNAALDGFHTDSESVRGKVMDINNYLTGLVTYDPNAWSENVSIYAHDAYGALVDPDHYAVCDGYSKAFLLLCEREGIECVIVLGTALPSMENHAWNYVRMDDDKWYAVDVTWNDNGKGDNPYFLKGGDTFFSSHQQGVFLGTGKTPYPLNSPAISSTGYDPDETAPNYDMYGWILGVAMVALLSFALYRFAKGNR